MSDPAHTISRFHERAREQCQFLANKYGIPTPTVVFLESNVFTFLHENIDPNADHKTLLEIAAGVLRNIIYIPESAEYYLTDDELMAILIHEFDHLLSPEVAAERIALELDINARKRWLRVHDIECETLEQVCADPVLADLMIQLQELSDYMEIKADVRVISEGYAAELASALQQINLAVYLGDEEQFIEPGQAITRVSLTIETLKAAHDPIYAAFFPSETFVERLYRLEMAAQDELVR